jgi:hypothetical protein
VGTLFFVKVDRAGFVKEPPPEVLEVLMRFTPAPLGMPREFTRAGRPIINVLAHLGLIKTPDDVDTPAKVLHAVERAVAQLQN